MCLCLGVFCVCGLGCVVSACVVCFVCCLCGLGCVVCGCVVFVLWMFVG